MCVLVVEGCVPLKLIVYQFFPALNKSLLTFTLAGIHVPDRHSTTVQ